MAEIHRIKCGTGNAYLINEGKSAILVDTGSKEFFDTVAEVCDGYDMKLVLLTHIHFDHAENACKLGKRYGIPVAFHQADEELFDDFDRQPMSPFGLTGRAVLGLSLKKLRKRKVPRPENYVYIAEGDSLAAYGINGRVVGLAGHTKGSVGVEVDGRHLIVGDAMDNWLKAGAAHLCHDRGAALRSAEKISSLGKRIIYYGHGRPTP
ncbi:MBL fold metallo-hydrolase [Ruminococcus sp.]|uniref:MBL fold metallo-hydrolase n=1 Tax=Ruminococcus sp. TaxID=41978 RepID=UPI0025E86918|nr:MBL fold metallo-hydrolase [Ruminococcus sp.]MBQ8965869.1 MBL fold metallo-hydrolase [Ruminococcus sp.]